MARHERNSVAPHDPIESELPMSPVRLTYYSDILCIWAYAADRRLEEVTRTFGDQVTIDVRYCSVFPDAWGKIETSWRERGGFAGFNEHINAVAEKFPHIEVYRRLWLDVRPRTSASAHLFLKAVELIERGDDPEDSARVAYLDRISTGAAAALRHAFFALGRDISDWKVHNEIADQLGIDYREVDDKIRSSEAVAALAVDYNLSQRHGIEGSPTMVMNDGRQKLFGNVGYRLIEANIQELLRSPSQQEASWC